MAPGFSWRNASFLSYHPTHAKGIVSSPYSAHNVALPIAQALGGPEVYQHEKESTAQRIVAERVKSGDKHST